MMGSELDLVLETVVAFDLEPAEPVAQVILPHLQQIPLSPFLLRLSFYVDKIIRKLSKLL